MDNAGSNTTAILVLSCDKYSDIWPVFFDFFERYWSDCPYTVYLGTNRAVYTRKGVKQVFSGKNSNWSDELKAILEQIKEDNIILLLEDYFIYRKVDNRELMRFIGIFERKNAAYMQLACFPVMYNRLWNYTVCSDEPTVGEIEQDAHYRVCLQVTLWKKTVLSSLLEPNESPWQFEIEGSKRTRSVSKPFLYIVPDPKLNYVHGPITYYCTALSAGKWMRGAIRLCEKEGIHVEKGMRPIESRWEEIYRKVYISMPIPVRKMIDFCKSRLMRR